MHEHEIAFIQDLAIIMATAGFITIIFHKIKQPIVLGYIIAGAIIGPYTPTVIFINDLDTIQIFSQLGVIFLMFSLGLEFNLRKLMKVGLPALVAAVLEILVMIWIGYKIGGFFHWSSVDSLFLGAMIAISSTTIIAKTLSELSLTKEHFAQLIFGILIIEDILAIAILAILSSIGTSEAFGLSHIALTLGKLLLFLTVSLSIGILIVPRFLSYVAKLGGEETLLITVLGLFFGFSLLVVKLHYSIVLGAFIIGAIIAESRQINAIERLIGPLRDMFSAVFFVTIGLLFDPHVVVQYALPIIVITIAVVFGKVLTCSFGVFITGQGERTGLRVGMGLAQIGEFSFIIAALGLSLNVTSKFLYPIAVSVSAVTTLLTPYLIKLADPSANMLKKILPRNVTYVMRVYTLWLHAIQSNRQRSEIKYAVQKSLITILINLALVGAIFICTSYLQKPLTELIFSKLNIELTKTILWSTALIFSLPFLIAIYRKLQALSMILAEFSIRRHVVGRFTNNARKVISETIPVFSMVIILLFMLVLSSDILPRIELLFVIIACGIIVALLLWNWFVKFHSRLQISLMETMKKKDKHSPQD
ncbi:MAG TPA: cation:proton antiporter [Gammaproteobacteria bacterium]|nr:cation:proton antiporter [Gammaproteobacteria bacterium]